MASLGFAEQTQEQQTKDFDIPSLKHKDLLKLYCQKVYDREGTFSKAAKFAGLAKSTFKDDYDEYVRGIVKNKRNQITQ